MATHTHTFRNRVTPDQTWHLVKQSGSLLNPTRWSSRAISKWLPCRHLSWTKSGTLHRPVPVLISQSLRSLAFSLFFSFTSLAPDAVSWNIVLFLGKLHGEEAQAYHFIDMISPFQRWTWWEKIQSQPRIKVATDLIDIIISNLKTVWFWFWATISLLSRWFLFRIGWIRCNGIAGRFWCRQVSNHLHGSHCIDLASLVEVHDHILGLRLAMQAND